jgi:phage-related minor tail protein
MQRLGSKVSATGGAMTKWVTGPLAAATAGVALLANKATTYTKELDRMTQVSNTNAQTFQRQAFAVKSVGIESDKYADILKDMNDRVGDFVNTGGGPMADFFEQIAPKVGVTAEQFRNLSGPDALQLYVNSLEKANLSQEEMTFYMEALASDSTALLPLLKNNGAAMKELGDRAEETGLILSDEVLESTREARGDMALFGQAMDVVSVQIGSALIPILTALVPVLIDVVVPAAKAVADVITTLVEMFTALPEPVQTFIAAAIGITAAIGPVLVVVGKVIGVIGGLVKAFVAVKLAVLAFAPALAPILVAAAPVIAIVAAVAAGIYLLVKGVQAIVEAFGGWEVVMAAFSEFFSGIWENMKQLAAQSAAFLGKKLNEIAQFFAALPDKVLAVVSNMVQQVVQFFQNMWENMKQLAAQSTAFLGQKLNEIAQFFAALPGKVLAFVSNMIQQVVQFFQNMGVMALNAVKNMVSQVVNYVKNMAANVISSIKSMFMAVVGNSIIPDMVRGVIGEFGNMTDQSIKDTERLVKGVNGTLAGINSRVAPGVDVSGGTAGRASTAGGNTTVDMRHAIIRDDKDMLDRMRRRGLEMTGAF